MRKIVRCFSLLKKCLSYAYEPPGSHCNPPQSIQSAVSECSDQGKLLILHLSLNEQTANFIQELSNEDFVIFSSPFNSRASFHITRNLPVSSLPFVGLFYCPSRNTSDVQLVDTFKNANEFSRIRGHFRRFSSFLQERRNQYISREVARTIVIDQDAEYNEILHQAQLIERKKQEELEKERKKEENKQQKINNALRRFNSLPNPPPKDDALTYDVQFIISNQKPKIRTFKATDEVSLLYDFVAVDVAPNTPVIKVGFPPRTLTRDDFHKSLSDLQFAKKQTVFVTSDDDEEEEEEETIDVVQDF